MTTQKFYQFSSRMDSPQDAIPLFDRCLQARQNDPSLKTSNARRLFNGFYEGLPGFVVDQFDQTLVLKSFARDPKEHLELIGTALGFYPPLLKNINCVLVKTRHARDKESQRGILRLGQPASEIVENTVRYALDLRLNQDDSFYLDTRCLRGWLKEKMDNKTVLNTFAYTGALGIAALAGGATEVIQTDLSPKFLSLAEKSARFTRFPERHQTLAVDYFKQMARFKSQNKLFDCVIIDPPLFSKTTSGEVHLLKNWSNLINKARPLVAHEGYLILLNNALFLSGSVLMEEIQKMCASGYLELLELIDIPQDVTGYPQTIQLQPPVPTAPFNHPTKISITRVRRKDGRRAS